MPSLARRPPRCPPASPPSPRLSISLSLSISICTPPPPRLPLPLPADASDETRTQAVRLLTSRLFPRPGLRHAILATAALRLSALSLPHALADMAAAPSSADGAASSAASGEAGAATAAPPAEPSAAECGRHVALFVALAAKEPAALLPGTAAA